VEALPQREMHCYATPTTPLDERVLRARMFYACAPASAKASSRPWDRWMNTGLLLVSEMVQKA
jgi:hypothetical protein